MHACILKVCEENCNNEINAIKGTTLLILLIKQVLQLKVYVEMKRKCIETPSYCSLKNRYMYINSETKVKIRNLFYIVSREAVTLLTMN